MIKLTDLKSVVGKKIVSVRDKACNRKEIILDDQTVIVFEAECVYPSINLYGVGVYRDEQDTV
jgi:hypothetical protein